MIDAAILDGDWVAVRQQTTAENGETVVAMINGEPTVKTLCYADGRVWLMPQNPVYEPIPAEKCTLLGKVVSVLRRRGHERSRLSPHSLPVVAGSCLACRVSTGQCCLLSSRR